MNIKTEACIYTWLASVYFLCQVTIHVIQWVATGGSQILSDVNFQ